MTGPAASDVYSNHFMQLMKAIEDSQKRMDDKLVHFQEKIHEGQDDTEVKALERAKYDKTYIICIQMQKQ